MTRVAFAAIVLAGFWTPALAGHEVTFYPSYYPHEIRIDTLEPAAAARRFENNTLHAYVGPFPGGGEHLPDHVKSVQSLGAFVVLGFNPNASTFVSAKSRCDAAGGILAALRTGGPNFVFHPYPVTP